MFAKLIVLMAVVTAALAESERISNGTEAVPGQFPYMLSIQDGNGNHKCGAVRVGDGKAITAARCLTGLNMGQARVYSGRTNVTHDGTEHRIRSFETHPDYAFINNTYYSDNIAVFHVNPMFPSNEFSGKAFLPPQGDHMPPGPCNICGWGATSMGGGSSSILRWASLPIWNTTFCEEIYFSIGYFLPDDVLCAGEGVEESPDFCDNDFGSPLVYNGVVFGIASYGGFCGSAFVPGIYTQVSQYRSWIDGIN